MTRLLFIRTWRALRSWRENSDSGEEISRDDRHDRHVRETVSP